MSALHTKGQLIQQLWRGHDPMRTLAVEDRPRDAQGWNSDHPYLAAAVSQVRPRVVVEVGVWKGGSVMTMARALKTLQLDAVVIAVDTWRGSSEHWLASRGDWGIDNEDDLGLDRGHSRLYEKFVSNIRAEELQDYVVPLPLDSTNAAHVLAHLSVKCGVMHLDGGHDYETVAKDLRLWWPLIDPGGILLCDDYGSSWPGVRKAVDEFAQANAITAFDHIGDKAMLHKPAEQEPMSPARTVETLSHG